MPREFAELCATMSPKRRARVDAHVQAVLADVDGRIVVTREASGTFSARVEGFPVYAQGRTKSGARRKVQSTFEAYLLAHPDHLVRVGSRTGR